MIAVHRKRVPVFAAFLGLFVGLIGITIHLVAAPNGGGPPKVSWSQASLIETIAAGASRTFTVSLTSTQNISVATTLRVAPELADCVSVTPATLASISANQPVSVIVTIAPYAIMSPQTVTGTIQLRNLGTSANVIAVPLPVTVNVVWTPYTNTSVGVQMSYPSFGLPTQVEVSPPTELAAKTTVDIEFKLPSDTDYFPAFGFALIPNSGHLSLSDWFHQKHDQDGSLVASGAFIIKHLPNGDAYILAGPLPASYNLGPIDAVYSISSSGNTIIVGSPDPSGQLSSMGFSDDQKLALVLSTLQTIQAP